MRLIRNSSTDRVLDALRGAVTLVCRLDIATSELSLFAFAELPSLLADVAGCRLVLTDPAVHDPAWGATPTDRGGTPCSPAGTPAAFCIGSER